MPHPIVPSETQPPAVLERSSVTFSTLLGMLIGDGSGTLAGPLVAHRVGF